MLARALYLTPDAHNRGAKDKAVSRKGVW
ncbi:MAG: hypothetical protein LZF86_190512 [Nitrospira sp.]|nr:MAG: hypothetical protein LZF86_190512 [Nitrospira sp.]